MRAVLSEWRSAQAELPNAVAASSDVWACSPDTLLGSHAAWHGLRGSEGGWVEAAFCLQDFVESAAIALPANILVGFEPPGAELTGSPHPCRGRKWLQLLDHCVVPNRGSYELDSSAGGSADAALVARSSVWQPGDARHSPRTQVKTCNGVTRETTLGVRGHRASTRSAASQTTAPQSRCWQGRRQAQVLSEPAHRGLADGPFRQTIGAGSVQCHLACNSKVEQFATSGFCGRNDSTATRRAHRRSGNP